MGTSEVFLVFCTIIGLILMFLIFNVVFGVDKIKDDEDKRALSGKDDLEDYVIQQIIFDDHQKH